MSRNSEYIIRIPFAKPCIEDEEYEAVKRVLKSNWITTGKESTLFEQEFSQFITHHSKNKDTSAVYTQAVQSATAGLHLSLCALNVTHGDMVITTPFTFVATASAILYTGATPLFVDCKKNSMYPDEREFERAVQNKKAKIFLPVHISGYAGENFSYLLHIAKKHKLRIVEDAAHAFPAQHIEQETNACPQFLGTIGDAGVYSFYANKTMTTAEGGMIALKDKALAQKISMLRNHGIDRTVWSRFSTSPLQYEYDIQALGYKYNLPDILSAIGRVQLKKVVEFQTRRRRAAMYYIKHLSDRDYLHMPYVPKDEREHSWHLFIIRISHHKLSRDDFVRKLAEHGIGTSVHYKPLSLMSYYKNKFGYNPTMFLNAQKIYQQSISLPLYAEISEEQLHEVCNTIIKIGDGII